MAQNRTVTGASKAVNPVYRVRARKFFKEVVVKTSGSEIYKAERCAWQDRCSKGVTRAG